MQKALNGATSQKAEAGRLDPRAALKILEERARGHDDVAIRDSDLGEILFEYLAEFGAAATRHKIDHIADRVPFVVVNVSRTHQEPRA